MHSAAHFLLFMTVPSIFAHLWSKSLDTSGHLALISKTSHPSIIKCAAICTKNAKCLQYRVVHWNNCSLPTKMCPLECYLLQSDATGDQKALPAGDIYSIGQCQGDPCKAQPCQNSGKCVSFNGRPECELTAYICKCPGNFAGRHCEVCSTNYTGPQCNVDISGPYVSKVDGIYFYAPSGSPKGSDDEAHLRPNCTESRRICQSRRMSLLTIKSAEKNATFAKLNLHANGCRACFFRLGLHQNTTTDRWFWDDNAPLEFHKAWYPGTPERQSPYFINDTEAAVLPATTYGWINTECKFPAYYVCEYDTSSNA